MATNLGISLLPTGQQMLQVETHAAAAVAGLAVSQKHLLQLPHPSFAHVAIAAAQERLQVRFDSFSHCWPPWGGAVVRVLAPLVNYALNCFTSVAPPS